MKQPLHTVWSKPKLLGWNTSYICSVSGILNILEMVICFTCIHLMNQSCRPAYSTEIGGFVGSSCDTYFYIAVNSSFIITATIFFCFVISQSSFMLAERTVMVLIFWSFSSIALLATSSFLLFVNAPVLHTDSKPEVPSKFAASMLGMLNFILYSINGIIAYRACRNSWLQL